MDDLNLKTQKTFKKWASHYDKDNWSWYFNYCNSNIIKNIGPKVRNDANILDIGCGTGSLIHTLSDIAMNGKIIGIDASPEMANIARKRNKDKSNVTVLQGYIEEFDTSMTFDIIFCLNTFHHVNDKKLVLNKIAKLLNKNGIFVYLDPFRDNVIRLLWEYVSKYLLFHEPYIKYFNRNSLINMFKDSKLYLDKSYTLLYVILICVLHKNGE